MKKNKLSFYFIFISASTLLSLLVAIAQQGYHNLMGPIESSKSNPLTYSLDPSLDVDVVNLIKSREDSAASPSAFPVSASPAPSRDTNL